MNLEASTYKIEKPRPDLVDGSRPESRRKLFDEVNSPDYGKTILDHPDSSQSPSYLLLNKYPEHLKEQRNGRVEDAKLEMNGDEGRSYFTQRPGAKCASSNSRSVGVLLLAVRENEEDPMQPIGMSYFSTAARHYAVNKARGEENKSKGKVSDNQHPNQDKKEINEEGYAQFVLVDPTLPAALQLPPDTKFIERLSDPHLPLPEREKLLLRFLPYYRNSPVPRSLGKVELHIRRNKSGFVKKLYPEYRMHLGSNDRFLMVGQRMQLMRSAYYLITADTKVGNRKSAGCLGKLRSNFQETEFDLFGVGENLDKAVPLDAIRIQHAAIVYNLGVIEVKSHNKMDVLLPKPKNDIDPYNCKPTSKEEYLSEQFKMGKKDNLICLVNKRLRWNSRNLLLHILDKNGYVVNFGERATVPSINNLQIVNPHDDTEILLQLGKAKDNFYRLDVAYPFSLYQAFGVCLTSFDFNC